MKKIINQKTAQEIPVGEVVNVINAGIQIVDKAAPVLSVLFDKINEWIQTLGKNNPNSPRNVRLRLAALEAKDALQKDLNKTYEARLAALETKIEN